MEYLVTGGAGFIGSHLVDALAKKSDGIIIVDDFSSGKENNLAHHKNSKNVIIYKKSVCDDLASIFENHSIDVVFHLAALPKVQVSIKHPAKTHAVNVNGTLSLLQLCQKFNIKKFVFSSSSAVYGEQKKLPFQEHSTPDPLSPYALHKFIGEQYCALFSKLYALDTISLRYFNVFGPRQNPEGDYGFLIPKFITVVNNNQSPVIFGDGEQTRDFVYVSDVVDALLLAAETKDKKLQGQIFNVGSGINTSVNEIATHIIALSKKNIKPTHTPPVIEPRNTLADISKIKKALGFSPKVSLEEGLTNTYKYFSKIA